MSGDHGVADYSSGERPWRGGDLLPDRRPTQHLLRRFFFFDEFVADPWGGVAFQIYFSLRRRAPPSRRRRRDRFSPLTTTAKRWLRHCSHRSPIRSPTS
ncbi:hypothetical protein M6B38_362545 [Iris pallida]|uniref:Uncharacterized protein n=1 Tax=Iris pallida TaxID=29817 RepID=A0AAX6GIW5_IRIPA|nr:hypothetical protein M6B38_362545 [Iris pallida]